MWCQVIGLVLDFIGVILLALSGVFKVSGGFQYGPTKEDYRMLRFARVGLALAAIGFIFQIVGVLQQMTSYM